ncbi:ComEC/Rec2 family competence protein [Tunturiibacter gelidoferens]|uniref:Competence protein ComEC n=1 Tax=Tunturiibacter gelidiferens TaxID=3069689 RepID=A0ACC5P2Y5_9BACT|nr:ComEC/Rec2 family competence protein [Edaphobacter lichenicola]MBB5341192.1 competence protein ComEC [Edaphobacter lichenicola]
MKTGRTNEPNPDLWPKAVARLPTLAFRRAPLLTAVCWFALGEVIARNHAPMVMLFLAMSLLCALTLASLRWSLRIAIVPLAAVWMALGLFCAEVQPAPPTQHALKTYADGLSRQVRGRVVRVRELVPQQGNSDQDKETGWWAEKEENEEAAAIGALSVDLQVDAVEEVTPDVAWMAPVTGGARMNVLPDKPAVQNAAPTGSLAPAVRPLPTLKCGDLVQAPMRMKVAEYYRDPAAWQYSDYLLAQGIGAHASVRVSKVSILSQASSELAAAKSDYAAQWQCKIFTAQNWASGRVLGYVHSKANRGLPEILRLNQDDAGMLNAMLFGDRAGLNKTQRVGFERTGSFHLFVVSGMHVGLLAGLVFWLARRLKLSDLLATLLTIVLTFGYALLTGFAAPVQRALFMTTVFLLARLLSRDRNVLNALGAAAMAVLVLSPNALFEASFQMTFLAIVAIGGIAIPLGERSFLPYARAADHLWDKWVDVGLPPRIAQFRLMLRMGSEAIASLLGQWSRRLLPLAVRSFLWALELSLIGVVAEMVMVLPMAVYFHRATMFAVPTNLLSVPLVAILAPTAVVTFCASLVSPWFALLPGAMTALLLHGVKGVIGRVSALHAADLRVPAPAWWVAILAVAAWAFCCWAVRRSRNWAWAAVFTLPLVALIVLWPEHSVISPGMMEVTAIDVGQGDSIFIVAPDGATMLIDAGGPVGGVTEAAEATSRFDVGEEVVSPYLWSRRFRRLDVLALSHAHSDHMGGMPAILRNFRPRELWVSIDPNSDAYRSLLDEAKDLGVTVRHFYAGTQLAWGGTQITMLAPEPGYANPGEPINNDSLVMRMQYGDSSVMLEGDAEAPSEREMLAHKRVAPVTLLKVGHHGSRTSTTQEFLDAAAPKDAVVSVGKGNTFGHPRYEVIERISEARTKLYRTDEFGLTTFLLGRDGKIRELVDASNP